ncbi:30S ribosomal protein S20 [bacterium]|nr:30S ribosomal protein S20 [bacterium]
MANIKSSKKDIKRSTVRTKRSAARISEIKTLMKKVIASAASGAAGEAKELFRLVESKIARAKGKGVLKGNTASRKISRLAKKVKAGQAS